ncbi:MAG: homoserine O-succinyltransferase [Bacteroidales bacterium]|jgi:homoserine O-succinyltransferase|nr:homoserine O-succinyltransferase [Bacteroidales bacterium]MBP5134429.1 homoserine O-succinyltransferase [Paludibacteraceae bacterium]MBR6310921.1 homoserine O-succinyltransferase [Paludibacteraceae bacterium]MDD6356943.1 homoserine O-succinyltransferase [Bacteroidales bacterium]
MPLNIPEKLPAIELLKKENIFVIDSKRANKQDIRPLKIAFLNLMPIKITAETDFIRLLSNTPLQIEIEFIKIKSHTSKNTPVEHMQAFYIDFDQIKEHKYDALIINGAPLDFVEYEDVKYWDELTEILDWAKTNVTARFFICWGAFAAMYYYYGIPKYVLPKKRFGIYEHKVKDAKNPIFRGFDDYFYMPYSRHIEVHKEDVEKVKGLKIIAESTDGDVGIVMGQRGREFFVFGHPEYVADTLANEYYRDKEQGKPIEIPEHYFENDDPRKKPVVRWRSHANLLFTNWLNYFVYQATPYDINSIH